MREHHRICPALRDPSRSHKLRAQTKDRQARLLTLSQRASCLEHLRTQGISDRGAAPVRLRRGAVRHRPRSKHAQPVASTGRDCRIVACDARSHALRDQRMIGG